VILTLREYQLYDKFEKCEYWHEEVVFLGHADSIKGMKVDLEKVKIILEWPRPN